MSSVLSTGISSSRQYSPSEIRKACGTLPRLPMAHLPTPLEFLPRLTRELGGPEIYIKRDDCTGLAFGGNKVRHNEFLFGKVRQEGYDLLVWGAGVQSNNCRQTTAACARLGIEIHLVLGSGDSPPGTEKVQGNLLLDFLMGAKVDIVPEKVGPVLDERLKTLAEEYRAKERRPFFWNREICLPLAAVSYLITAAEISEQLHQLGKSAQGLYVSSSGSTGSGLALAQAALGESYLVQSVAPLLWPWHTEQEMAQVANRAAELTGLATRLTSEDIRLDASQIAPGYGLMSEASQEAISLTARLEGIFLDPIYTGKAMAALIHDVRQGRWKPTDRLIFVHTGGTPALFAYADYFQSGRSH